MAEPYQLTDADRHEWDRWDAWNNLQGSVTRDVYGGPVGLGQAGKDFKWNPNSSLSDFSAYWDYDKAAGPRSTSDLSGVGWLPTNQEVARSQYLAPSDTDWEYTKFVRAPWHSGEDIRTGASHRGLHKWDFEFNQPQK